MEEQTDKQKKNPCADPGTVSRSPDPTERRSSGVGGVKMLISIETYRT